MSYQQPPFAQYPRQQRMPSGVTPRPPGVHIEAITEAINLFQREWSTYVLSALIAMLICGGMYVATEIGIFAIIGVSGRPGVDAASNLAFIPVLLVIYLVAIVVYLCFYYGLVAMALKQIRGYPISVGDVFSGFRFAPRLLGTSVLLGVASIIGTICCIVPGLWVSGSLKLAPIIAMDQDKGVIDSLNESWRVAGNFVTGLTMWGMLFLLGIIAQVGVIACCVGVLATIPIAMIATAVEYFYFFPEQFGIQDYAVPIYGGTPPPTEGS